MIQETARLCKVQPFGGGMETLIMGEPEQTNLMERKPVSHPSETHTLATDPFYYGYRTVAEVQADYRKTFDVQKEGARPCLIVEVISPLFPGDDTVKVDLYQQMGIAEYIISKPQTEDNDPGKLIGYCLKAGQYQPIQPDQQGRILSRTTNLWFALNETIG